ncbi:MAG: pectin methylesterase, partial [Flavobacteriaceae bacterium]|nr:pectin methylesterase [Flavobacteriaceae bacterium]
MVRFRDSVDMRIINDTEHGSTTYKNGIIDSQNDVGGWPVLKLEKAAPDADGDGIPDSWEKEHSLNINENDAAMFTLSDTYTNIEVYANSLVQEIAENEYK